MKPNTPTNSTRTSTITASCSQWMSAASFEAAGCRFHSAASATEQSARPSTPNISFFSILAPSPIDLSVVCRAPRDVPERRAEPRNLQPRERQDQPGAERRERRADAQRQRREPTEHERESQGGDRAIALGLHAGPCRGGGEKRAEP